MPRNYIKKKQVKYTQDDMAKALQAVSNNEMSMYAAAKNFHIPLTTLFDRLKDNATSNVGRPLVIPFSTEKRLADAITTMEKWGFGLSRQEILDIVGEYVEKNSISTPFTNNRPGPDWFLNFKKRHGLSIKKPQPVEYARKKMTDPFIISEFFELLKNTMTDNNLFEKPELLWNLDETSLSLDPTKTKVVGKINKPCSRTTCGTGKENITVLTAVSATGKKISPLIVFKGKQMWDRWMAKTDNYGFEMSYAASAKGWMETTIFYNYMEKIFIPALGGQRPVLLVYDGHSTHVDANVIELAIKNNITILKLPPHTSHLLQPLDVAVFKSFKTQWDTKLVEWQRHNIGKKMPKNIFAQTLAETWHQTEIEVIQSGFKKTGIYPFNSNVIPEDKYDPAALKRFKEKEKSSTAQYQLRSEVPKRLIDLCINFLNKHFIDTDLTIEDGSTLITQVTDYNTTGVTLLSQISKEDAQAKRFVANHSSDLPQCLRNERDIKVSIEELVLERIRQEKQDHKVLKRKRVAKGAEVITHTILKENKEKELEEKAQKKILNKRTPKIKKKSKTNSTLNSNAVLSVSQCYANNLEKGESLFDTEYFDNIDFRENLLDTEYERELKDTTIEILDEQTGHLRKMVVTNAVIDKPKSLKVLTESDTKSSRQEKRKSKIKKTCENSSTTSEEEIIMSIHSDSDIDNVLSLSDYEIENEEVIKKRVDETEAAIFAKIMALDEIDKTEKQLQNETAFKILEDKINVQDEDIEINKKVMIGKKKNLRNKNKECKSIHNKQKTAIYKNENKENKNEDESTMLTNEVTTAEYDIGQTVLVRYYERKKWKFYVGLITDIKNSQLERKYGISFYKTVQRNSNLKFVKPKKTDDDLVPIDLIVKEIQLVQIRDNPNEYVLNDAKEEIYF